MTFNIFIQSKLLIEGNKSMALPVPIANLQFSGACNGCNTRSGVPTGSISKQVLIDYFVKWIITNALPPHWVTSFSNLLSQLVKMWNNNITATISCLSHLNS